MNRWFRWYEGTCEDTKLRIVHRIVKTQDRITDNGLVTVHNDRVTLGCVIGVWACLLEDACRQENDGIATRHWSYISAALDMGDNDVQEVLEAMRQVGLIAQHDQGNQIVAWGKRQFKSDRDPSSAERQKRFRQRHNALLTPPEQNRAETEQNRTEKKARKRAEQLPYEDFDELPEDWRLYVREKRPDLDAQAIWLDFRDYWKMQAKPMVDWARTWQRWVRNQRGTPMSRAANGHSTPEKWRHLDDDGGADSQAGEPVSRQSGGGVGG